jgi:uncharacterized Zn finger protein
MLPYRRTIMKKCTKCGEVKPLQEFYAHPTIKDGYRTRCKKCHNVKPTMTTNELIDAVKALCAKSGLSENDQYVAVENALSQMEDYVDFT